MFGTIGHTMRWLHDVRLTYSKLLCVGSVMSSNGGLVLKGAAVVHPRSCRDRRMWQPKAIVVNVSRPVLGS